MQDLKMEDSILEELVNTGELKSYVYETVESEPGSNTRETERVTLVFSSGKKLVLETFSSGWDKNSCLMISK